MASCSDPGTTITRQIATGWHHSLASSVPTYSKVYMNIWKFEYTIIIDFLDIDISLDLLRMMLKDANSGCEFHDF